MDDMMMNNAPVPESLEFESYYLKQSNECFKNDPDISCLCATCRFDKVSVTTHVFNGKTLEIKYLQFENFYYIVWIKARTKEVIIGWRLV